MGRRSDISRILVIGSGPIVIGQGCEFDYSGTQAIKALKAEGYYVVLVNSNPATIMTDPELADETYIEPLTPAYLEAVFARNRIDAILPTVGGQTALNLTLQLHEQGVLQRFGVEVIGASIQSIKVAEDRALFRQAMQEIQLDVPTSVVVEHVEDALAFGRSSGYPLVIRPSFTLGGSGGGIAYNAEECAAICAHGLDLSPVTQVLVEESLIGWKEFELEVVRDLADNVVIVCSIENLDPMGVHTGDSITVAPAQTLTDREYQRMRTAAMSVLRKVGVQTGGSNVQFAVNPKDGRLVVIEMNPRVSRSSALASKATGYPIAKVAARLAVGYTLDEITNEITKTTSAAFEPALDYVVTKIPKFAFEKFPGSDATLGTQMKSVGEVMAIGRTFKESFFKALRALEVTDPWRPGPMANAVLDEILSTPGEHRLRATIYAMERGYQVADVARLTRIDPWFVDQLHQLAELQRLIRGQDLTMLSAQTLTQAKRWGFSDRRLADLMQTTAHAVRRVRLQHHVQPVYKRIDTCAAEFASYTPYFYSSYEQEDESAVQPGRKILILGSGPNRIGQGIEFDYCCSHAAMALSQAGVQSIMLNCNPETVSTDYDTSDRLYFEPLTLEDVLEVIDCEKPDGVIVQFGGQTPLNLTAPLHAEGVTILGTSPDAVDLAEDRQRFNGLLDRLNLRYPAHAFASSVPQARAAADALGYPVLVRPSYVLGGRAMAIATAPDELMHFVTDAFAASAEGQNQVLIDTFLEDAFEYDVDALCDGKVCIIAGIMEHIEQAGVHSGDSCAVLPPYMLSQTHLDAIKQATRRMAIALGVVGLMNVQFAIAQDVLYVLEVNPRASRTIPFVAKATGVPLAKIATRLMLGQSLAQQGLHDDLTVERFFVKAPVFPFAKFAGFDPKLSPEMRSTGEVMGAHAELGVAFYKALLMAGTRLPLCGAALITVNARDYAGVVPMVKRLLALKFVIFATKGNAGYLRQQGLDVQDMLKQSEGRPNCIDLIKSHGLDLIINTPLGVSAQKDGLAMRTAAICHGVPLITTLSGAAAAIQAIEALQDNAPADVVSLQQINAQRSVQHRL